jgi:hypothetical protein
VQFGAKRRGTIRRIGFLCCLVQAVQAVSVQLGAKRRGAIRKVGFCVVWSKTLWHHQEGRKGMALAPKRKRSISAFMRGVVTVSASGYKGLNKRSKCAGLTIVHRVGQNHICIYGVYTVFLAGKLPNTRSCTVYIYGSGQP